MNISRADKAIRIATALTVVTVSAIAAIVSYTHIVRVSLTHGQSALDARLMPISVDGLIVAASLSMFYAGRNRLPVPNLARFALALGIGSTIAVNCLYGIAHGWLGAVLSAWPAISFIVAVELLIWTVRAAVTGKPYTRRESARKPGKARAWARSNGYDVNDRGRLPADVAEAFAEASGDAKRDHANGQVPKDIVLVASESS